MAEERLARTPRRRAPVSPSQNYSPRTPKRRLFAPPGSSQPNSTPSVHVDLTAPIGATDHPVSELGVDSPRVRNAQKSFHSSPSRNVPSLAAVGPVTFSEDDHTLFKQVLVGAGLRVGLNVLATLIRKALIDHEWYLKSRSVSPGPSFAEPSDEELERLVLGELHELRNGRPTWHRSRYTRSEWYLSCESDILYDLDELKTARDNSGYRCDLRLQEARFSQAEIFMLRHFMIQGRAMEDIAQIYTGARDEETVTKEMTTVIAMHSTGGRRHYTVDPESHFDLQWPQLARKGPIPVQHWEAFDKRLEFLRSERYDRDDTLVSGITSQQSEQERANTPVAISNQSQSVNISLNSNIPTSQDYGPGTVRDYSRYAPLNVAGILPREYEKSNASLVSTEALLQLINAAGEVKDSILEAREQKPELSGAFQDFLDLIDLARRHAEFTIQVQQQE